MYTRIDDFLADCLRDAAHGQKLFDALTDESLSQRDGDRQRSLGEIAWHAIQSVSETLNQTGLGIDASRESEPVPTRARDIADAHRQIWADVINEIRQDWN